MRQKIIATIQHALFQQLFRFGLVGVLGTCTHIAIVITLVELTHMHPLMANVFAFSMAFWVSYYGHRHWTFAETKADYTTIHKFLLVAISSFLLNESIYYVLLNHFHIQYIVALVFVILTVPMFTFTFSKFWAFR